MQNAFAIEIANAAARLVVEEGLEWGPAKRRAVKQLGLPARTPLPEMCGRYRRRHAAAR